jgi:glycosyltransferase involved in cell wall biosynthesis
MAVVDVSFIILCWNSRQHLDGVLSSISRDLAATDLTYEVIVIDNGSRDDSLQRLRDWQIRLEEQSPVPARLFIVPLGSNTGTTFSRNIGLRMARGKYICILDSDITFNQPDTLTRLIAILDKYPQAGLVVPSLIYATGRHQKSCDVFPTITHKIKRRFFLRQIEQRESDKKQHGGQLASDPSLVLVEDLSPQLGRFHRAPR